MLCYLLSLSVFSNFEKKKSWKSPAKNFHNSVSWVSSERVAHNTWLYSLHSIVGIGSFFFAFVGDHSLRCTKAEKILFTPGKNRMLLCCWLRIFKMPVHQTKLHSIGKNSAFKEFEFLQIKNIDFVSVSQHHAWNLILEERCPRFHVGYAWPCWLNENRCSR